jgi:hypothetical protein
METKQRRRHLSTLHEYLLHLTKVVKLSNCTQPVLHNTMITCRSSFYFFRMLGFFALVVAAFLPFVPVIMLHW